jgi:hypothetical protein
MITRPPIIPPNDYAGRFFSCLAIVLAVGGFFWTYDAITHRVAPYVPEFKPVAQFVPSQAPSAHSAPNVALPILDIGNDVASQSEPRFSKPDISNSRRTKTASAPKKKHARIPKAATRRAGYEAFARGSTTTMAAPLFGGF